MVLTDNELFQLKKMIESNNTSDQTEEIRSLKHSKDIRDSIKKLITLKMDKRDLLLSDKDAFEVEALSVAGFLFYNYFVYYILSLFVAPIGFRSIFRFYLSPFTYFFKQLYV